MIIFANWPFFYVFSNYANCRETTTTDGAGSVAEVSTYDATGNLLTKVISGGDVDRITYTYDANGNPLTEQDKKGFFNTYTYDALDRISTNLYSGPWSQTITFAYDAVGNRTYANEQGPTEISFDLAGQIVTMIREGDIVTHTYDLNGKLGRVSVVGPGCEAVTRQRHVSGVFRWKPAQQELLPPGHLN